MVLGLLAVRTEAGPAPPPIEAFARPPSMSSVAISPDGRYVSWISATGDVQGAMVFDRRAGGSAKAVMAADSKPFRLSWCNWANADRLLCGLAAITVDGDTVYPVTRLVAVNADGSKMTVLMQDSRGGGSQFQDEVLDFTPDEPNNVLIAAYDDTRSRKDVQVYGPSMARFPSVFELNVYTGDMRMRLAARDPISWFVTDGRGHVRIGGGTVGTKNYYFARLEADTAWRQLAKVEAFAGTDVLRPIAVGRGPTTIYAMASSEGREALWEMDLTDRQAPQVVFSHPAVDVGAALFAKDGRMLGVFYETDRPFVYFTDPRAEATIAQVNRALPDRYNQIEDSARDESAYVIGSSSDVDAGTYYLLDPASGKFQRLGDQYPELDPATLGRMQSIAYDAKDGTRISGYLTVPPGVRAEHLPLIVMPHGGPIYRDYWEFDFLRAFLVSRGYAVLQMNFRGSSGYGDKWFAQAHQDWGGLTYSDIEDGARWAVKQGTADPKRLCMVGWSFGGYAALLGAERAGDLFSCSVSIAGVSDLVELEADQKKYLGWQVARVQIGTDAEKLRQDSPRRHADAATIPVLMIHGTRDYQVEVTHSRIMAKALEKAHKPYELVIIKDASHQMERQSDRVTLLAAVEKFLRTNLGPGVQAPSP